MEKKSKTIAQALLATTKRQAFGKDFQYVVQRPVKAKICFGSSQERKETAMYSRLAAQCEFKAHNNLTPGMYLNSSKFVPCRPTSTRGTVIGGRTAPREPPIREGTYPSPCTYTLPSPPTTPGPRFRGNSRYRSNKKRATVGPGFYNLSAGHRKMEFACTLGGKKRLVPAIEMKCGPVNPDTCEKCKKPPVGDYWQLNLEVVRKERNEKTNNDQQLFYLCRQCHEKERRQPKLFSKNQINQFKKIRDCSQVHFHDGCEARLLLLPPRDIKKIREKEAYLALYFP